MEILYISSAASENIIKEVVEKYLNGNAFKAPQQTFDYSIADGLSRRVNLELLSMPPIPSYPKSSCIIFRRKIENINDDFKINYMPVINITGIKSICITINTLLKIFEWSIKKGKEKKVIILHWPFYPTMFASNLLKRIINTKVLLIVPDLPKYNNGYKHKGFKNSIISLLIKFRPELEKSFDGYILLTKQMNELINPKQRPYMILEGLVKKENLSKMQNAREKSGKQVIMYAGAVYEKFGIAALLEGFHKFVKSNCELWIFGNGDYVDKVKEYEKLDSRIKYKGVRFREEILEYEKKSTLLVNPRPTAEEFTKYSFPSKTLEYMASGTPLLSTKLEGIPNDYEDYILWFDDESATGMGNKINEVLEKGNDWLVKYGKRSKSWVESNKNSDIQTRKIINFINNELL